MIDFIQINDWGIKKFTTIISSIQFVMWGVIGFELLGLQIPIIRQLFGFIYLSFIPGVLILRTLKLHNLGIIETLLYSIGLSISFLMFIGFLINTMYPIIGISKPISTISLIITISIVILMLTILCYLSDKVFDEKTHEIKDLWSLPTECLLMLPLLTIFGTYFVNFYHNNIFLLIIVAIVSLIVCLVGFNKFIPSKLYPFAVLIISLSLLLHTSLISNYIWGWDIHHEYYLSNLVINNSIWDTTIQSNPNSLLSIVMIGPIFSDILGISQVWVFKICYTLLYSLVPLGLYRVFQKQSEDKIAFLSCFFFMSVSSFYTEMPSLARQQIAELFFILLILIMTDHNIVKIKRSFLLVVFSLSMIVSHYGLSYIYLATLILAWAILTLLPHLQKFTNASFFKHNKYTNEKLIMNLNLLKSNNRTIVSSNYVLLFVASTLGWYIFVSGSSTFNIIILITNHIINSLYTDFLNPDAAEGLRLILSETRPSFILQVSRIINYTNQLLIIVGVFFSLISDKSKFEKEYMIFSLLSLNILFASISVPFFASALAMSRLYHITLFFLAPFCVIGGIKVFNLINKQLKILYNRCFNKECSMKAFKIISIYLMVFFLLQVGFISEIVDKGSSTSISLNNEMDYPKYNDLEIIGAKWLIETQNSHTIYADNYRWLLFNGYQWNNVANLPYEIDKLDDNSYIYLGNPNINYNKLVVIDSKSGRRVTKKIISLDEIIINNSKIYNNGGSNVYFY